MLDTLYIESRMKYCIVLKYIIISVCNIKCWFPKGNIKTMGPVDFVHH